MESSLVEGVADMFVSFIRDGRRVHNHRRPSHACAKWIDPSTLP